MSETPRRPQAFRLDSEEVEIAPLSDAPVPSRSGPPEAVAVPVPAPAPKSSGFARLFWAGLGGIVSLAVGLAVTRLIEDLFARAEWLGWAGLAALAMALAGGLVLLGREALALRRLARFDRLRLKAEAALAAADDSAAGAAADELIAMLAGNARTARGRAAYAEAVAEGIVDGRQRLRIAERETLEPLDREATRMVAEAARRVSLVTAVSPRAAIDLAMVFATAVRLVRRLADLYGGRPGTLGMVKLVRQVLAHLALTGGMAAGDTILDQLVGQGLAAKLSAKLGEGVLNGFLTARLGVTAIAVTRPLPYIGAPPPDLRDLAGDVFRSSSSGAPKPAPPL